MLPTQYFIRLLSLLVILSINMPANSETITIATGEYPPWTSEKLAHGGFINRVVSSAFALHDIDVEFHYMPWKRALEATKVGQFNGSSFWAIDKDRQNDFFESDIVESDAFVFFHRRSLQLSSWDSLDSLSKFHIGATRGYTYSEEFWRLRENNTLRISLVNDDITNLQRLIDDEIDLFPISLVTGQYLLKENFAPHKTLKVSAMPKPLNSDKVIILFSKADEINQKYTLLFNKGLAQLKQQKKIEAYRREFIK